MTASMRERRPSDEMPSLRTAALPDFREGAARIVTATGDTIAEVAEDLGITGTTLASRGLPRPSGRGRAGRESDELERPRGEVAPLTRDHSG